MRLTRYLVIIAALAAMGLAAIHLRARATRIGYEIARERGREQELLEERAHLRFDLGRLKAPDRIIEQAERLNLVPVPSATGGLPASGRSALRTGGQAASGARR